MSHEEEKDTTTIDIQNEQEFERVVADYFRALETIKEQYRVYKEEKQNKDMLYRSIQKYMTEHHDPKEPLVLRDESNDKTYKLRVTEKTKYGMAFNKRNLVQLLERYLQEKLNYSDEELRRFGDSFDEFIETERRATAYRERQLNVQTVQKRKANHSEEEGQDTRKRKFLKSFGGGEGHERRGHANDEVSASTPEHTDDRGDREQFQKVEV